MGGSLNYHARRVRDTRSILGYRKSALFSCMRIFTSDIREPSREITIANLSYLVGANLKDTTDESHYLEALLRMEKVHNQILELKRAYERKRIRLKFRGKRIPTKAENQELSDAIMAVRLAAGMYPINECNTLVL